MSIKFKKKLRYDKVRASAGIWVDAEQDGEVFGRFKVRVVDGTIQSNANEMRKARASRAAALGVKKLSEAQEIISTVVDYALLDWAGIEDEAGKPVPFSTEAAWEFFSDEDNGWIVQNLLVEAVNPANFASVEAVKN